MFALPSLRALSKKPPPPPPPPSLGVVGGFEGIYGTSGLSLIYSGDSDDSFYNVTIPFTFNFFGVNYGNGNNGGVAVGTNGYVTFGYGASQYSGYSASSPGRGLFFLAADRRLYNLYAGSMSPIKGVSRYRVYWNGTSYSNTSDSFTVEIIFYSDGKMQVNYGTISGTIGSVIQGISNGTSYTTTWSVTSSSVSIAIASDDTTIYSGYWA